jgi:hypothetical protein
MLEWIVVLAALCAFWCSYVGGRALLMFQSRRLRSGRVRHHRNGYLIVGDVQNSIVHL